jgi:hypothetical protein
VIRELPVEPIGTKPEPISARSPLVSYPADGHDFMFKRLIAFATVLVSLILLGMVAGR